MPQKMIGSLPQETIAYFKNRQKELEDLEEYLANQTTRIINIIGRAGIGKTSLVAQLVKDLRQNSTIKNQKIDGIIIIQCYENELALFSKIYLKFGKLIGKKDELIAILNDKTISTEKTIEHLLEILREDYYILVLDSFETQLENDKIKPEINDFFEMILRSEYKGKIILTSREPIIWHNKHTSVCKRLGLDKGLPKDDAVQLLEDLGEDVSQIIEAKDEKKEKLKQIAEKSQYIPRALETIVGILKNKPIYSIDDLLEKKSLWCGEILKELIAEQYNSLFPDAQQIIQALSVYNKNVKREAILSILPNLDLENILNSLINNYIIQYNSKDYTLGLHPLTQQYIYYTLTDEQKKELETKCADFYEASKKTLDEANAIEDLKAHIDEINHLTRAGHYERAARVLTSIDYDYLILWGHYKLLSELWESLIYELKTPDLQMNAYNDLGVVYKDLGKVRESIPLLEKGLQIAKDEEDKGFIGTFTGNLGNSHLDLGEYKKTLEYYKQYLKIARKIGDRRREGKALGNLGVVYSNLGEYQKAIKYYEQALEIAREIGNRRDKGNSLGNLGLTYSDLGEYQKAIKYYEQALEIAREIGNRKGESANLCNLGSAYRKLGEYQKAIEYYEQHLEIAREIRVRRDEGQALCGLGIAYANLGEYQKAIKYYEQALEIDKEIGDRRGEGADLGNLGNAYYSLGEYQKAIEYYEQIWAIAREIGNRKGEANTLNNLGVAYEDLKDYKLAREYYEKSLPIYRWLGNPISLKVTLENLIGVCEQLGDKEGAEEYRREVNS